MPNSTTQRKENLIILALDLLLDVLIHEEEQKVCQPTYYKNLFLDRAIRDHISLQCIVRTYSEMLKASGTLTSNNIDLLHANALLDFLRIYDDEKDLEYINDLIYFLRQNSRQKFPYIIAKSAGRLKSFKSFEAKERNKLLHFEVYRKVKQFELQNLQELFVQNKNMIFALLDDKGANDDNLELREDLQDFSFFEEDKDIISSHLQKLLAKNVTKNPCKDIVGYRVVIYSVNSSTDEDNLTDFLYTFNEELKDFFLSKGFECSSEKDYVKNPKPNGYQSLHTVIDVLQIPVEIQIRTKRMDDTAENGTAAHNSQYKDNNLVYVELEKILTDFSEKYGKTGTNTLLGILDPLDTSNKPWCSTPHEEIPYTPKELKAYHDINFIRECFNRPYND